jgi:hypothetical protein
LWQPSGGCHDRRVAGPDRDHLARNAAGLRQLLAAARGVGAGRHPARLEDGWTAAALICHLAFWDRFVIARWDQYDRDGTLLELPEAHQDLVNAAALPLWSAVAPETAAAEATGAARAVCRRIAELSPAATDHALATGRIRMLDRTLHWLPHLEALEAEPRG